MRRTFVEFAGVTRVLQSHQVPDDALLAMQIAILQGEGDVVKETAGLRKIRCAASGRGKSGGLRVIFADYPEASICLLVAAFAKNTKANLTKAQRNDLAGLKAKLDAQIRQRFIKGRI